MIKIEEKFYGSEVTFEGTYNEIIKDLENISRSLIYQGFDKDDLIDTVIEGFFENPNSTPLDGSKVSDDDIRRVSREYMDEPIEKQLRIIKNNEESE